MTRRDKLIDRILRGSSDADIAFDELCTLLGYFGFTLRVRGSHHLFSKPGITEKINLQRMEQRQKPIRSGKCEISL